MQIDGRAAFLISKPLQLMIALLLLRQLKLDQSPVFVITNSFSGAAEVARRLGQVYADKLTALFFDQQPEAFAHLRTRRYRHIFIDSDVGFRKAIMLANLTFGRRGVCLYVFEEGAGTYREDLYPKVKARIFSAFGIASRFGASPFVSRIFVLDSVEYISKFPDLSNRVTAISNKMIDFIVDERAHLSDVFGFSEITTSSDQRRDVCRLYLSNWTIDEKFLVSFLRLSGGLYFKAHPHILKSFSQDGLIVIDSGVPAELAIARLLEIYERVQVYDHGSSVRRYVSSPRLAFESVGTVAGS